MSDTEPSDLALTLPLSGVQAIEASAGTGKTYALAGIHARLIVEKKLQVRDILVVTYTRAAADELRKRLRERLTLCAQIAAEPKSPADDAGKADVRFCRKLIARALDDGEPRELLLRRLRLAALSLDEAQISTVHAFCERALREQVWRAGVQAAEGKLIDIKPMLGTLAADLWRERATGADAQGWYALTAVAKSADGFADLMQELCDAQSVLEPDVAESAERLRERIAQGDSACRSLGDIWRTRGAAAMTVLIEHARGVHLNLSSYPPERIATEARALTDAFASGAQPDTKLLARYTSAAIEAKRNKQGRPLPPQLFFAAAQTTIVELEQADDARRQLGLLILRDCAHELRRRLQHQQRDVHGYTYDDLISRLHESVRGAHGMATAKALAKRFPAALVDECQDSDARQFEVFSAIYQQRGLLALVGDPKQSIYRFRGGDVHAYLDAREHADARHALDRNFRSTPALIGAFNRLYRDAGDAAFDSRHIRYEPVQPGGSACDDDLLIEGVAPPPLCFWQADAASSKADAELTLAAGCAEEIVHLLVLARSGTAQLRREQDDGSTRYAALRAEDLAVLVARHDEATVMQRALSARGVPSVVVSRASVFASDTARELVNLLRALDSFDPARLRGVLSSRLLGNTQAGIAALRSDATAWHEQAARFAQWRERWREHGVLALVEIVAEESAARLLAHVDGERCLTNLLHLAELLQEAERERDGARALIDWLQQRIAYADKEREEEQLRLESDAGRVHIVTVHASKGLEYPIVFLPFAALRRKPRSMPRYTRFARTQRIVHVCGVGDDGQAKAVERSEAQAEASRLLYVALTRARVRCYVAWGEIGQGEPPALANLLLAGADSRQTSVSARIAELAASAPELIACAPLPVPTPQRPPGPDLTRLAPARQMRERVHEWRRSHSFSGLSAGARETLRGSTDIAGGEDERNVVASAIDAPTVPTVLRGTRFGTAFHELLEKVDFAVWRDWTASSPPPAQRELVDRLLHRYALDSSDDKSAARAVVVQLIAATLNAPLPLGARLVDLAPTEHRAEMPFHFAIRSGDAQPWLARMQADGYVQARTHFALEGNRLAGLMTGVLDLVVLHGARWWVIDYKTNLLGTNAAADYAPARLASAVREGEYDLQYLIYLTALHRWLKTRLGAAYDYERDIGGALYLFVRGLDREGVNGVHWDKPPAALIEALDEMLKAPAEIAA